MLRLWVSDHMVGQPVVETGVTASTGLPFLCANSPLAASRKTAIGIRRPFRVELPTDSQARSSDP